MIETFLTQPHSVLAWFDCHVMCIYLKHTGITVMTKQKIGRILISMPLTARTVSECCAKSPEFRRFVIRKLPSSLSGRDYTNKDDCNMTE